MFYIAAHKVGAIISMHIHWQQTSFIISYV